MKKKCERSCVSHFFFSSRRRHTRFDCDWSSDVCSSDLALRWREIVAPAKPQVLDTATGSARPRVPIAVKKRKWAPPANHPWHQAVRREVQKIGRASCRERV